MEGTQSLGRRALAPPSDVSRACVPRRKTPVGCCARVRTDIKFPDPAIYSQDESLASGVEPSWDSPDIISNDRWPWVLRPDLEVTVHNRSPSASAINTVVQIHYSDFGIGMPRTQHTVTMTSIGPSSARTLVAPMGDDLLNGDPSRGFFVRISHPHDEQQLNNVGEQVHTAVQTSESGRTGQISFPVRNPTGVPGNVGLSVMANDIGGVVSPGVLSLAPFAQSLATLRWSVPGHLPGAEPVERRLTVVARLDGGLLGGLTLIVDIDS